jgi:hypothetical protein
MALKQNKSELSVEKISLHKFYKMYANELNDSTLNENQRSKSIKMLKAVENRLVIVKKLLKKSTKNN